MIVVLAFFCACLSDFFDDIIKDDMIFERWGKFVNGKFWLKPLGGCLLCTNVWVNIAAFFVINGFNFDLSIINLLFQIGVSNLILKKLII